MTATVTIKLTNFDKYKGRSDVKNNSWFRCSNRLLEDQDFYDFTHEEINVWIYFLSLASQKNQASVHVSYQRAHQVCRLSREAINSAIEKLIKIGALDRVKNRTVRGRYVHDTHPCATDRQTDITNKQTDTRSCTPSVPVPSLKLGTETKEVISRYCENWKSKYGSNPDIGGKERGILKTLTKDLGRTRALTLVDAYFAMPDAWLTQRRHDLGTFRIKLTEVGHFADTGSFITRSKVREIDENLHHAQKNRPSAEDEARLAKIFEPETKSLDGAS